MRKWAERSGLCGELRALRRPVAVLFAALLAALLPLLLADFHYLDDLGRAAIGYRRWGEFGRYLSEYGSVLVHAGTHLTDISPLPQLLAALIMAAACAVSLAVLRPGGAKGSTLWELAASLPLALCPYFLECFSYQFDAPYMAAAVLASVAPALLWGRVGCLAYGAAAALGTLTMCVSYQAASGIFPMLTVFLALREWNAGRPVLRRIVSSAAGYLLGLVIFRAALMPRVDSYVATSLLPMGELLPGFFAQLLRYYRLVLSDFKKGWLALIALIVLLYAVSFVCRSRQKKPLAAVAVAAGLAVAAALAFGAYPALERPLEEPRAMQGVGALIAFAAIGACGGADKPRRLLPARVCCLALCWCFAVFAATYGNALAEQQRYAQFRMELVLGDLNELPIMNNGTTKVMAVSGDIGRAPALRHIPRNQGILDRLVPTVFSGETWGENYLYSYYGMKNVAMLEDGSAVLDETDITQLGLPVIKETMYHTIRGVGQYVVVELK